MTRPDDELDNLLRSHLSRELDGQRGQSVRAFEAQVTAPMRRQLKRRSWQAHLAQWRHWGAIGLSMAACVAIGALLPSLLNRGATAGEAPGVAAEPAAAQLADFERTTVLRHVDAGAVVLEDGTPGRKILQHVHDTVRFTDPATGERLEYVRPADPRDLVYAVERQ